METKDIIDEELRNLFEIEVNMFSEVFESCFWGRDFNLRPRQVAVLLIRLSSRLKINFQNVEDISNLSDYYTFIRVVKAQYEKSYMHN